MIRTTTGLLYKDIIYNLNRITTELQEKNLQVSTGKRVNRPSDDPVDLVTILGIKETLRQMDQYQTDVDLGQTWLGTTETALNSILDRLNEAKELAEQMATGTYSEEERENALQELQNIYEQMITLGNTQLNHRYIFSGSETSTAALTADWFIQEAQYGEYNSGTYEGVITTSGAYAGLVTGFTGDNNDLSFIDNNDGGLTTPVRIRFVDPGVPTATTTASVAGSDITVTLAYAASAQASLTTTGFGVNGDITYTAATAGTAGNDIQIQYIDGGNTGVVGQTVTVSGDTIRVLVTTDGANYPTANAVAAAVDGTVVGGITVNAAAGGTGLTEIDADYGPTNLSGGLNNLQSTAADVIAAIQASTEANDLISVSSAVGDDGTGYVEAMAYTDISALDTKKYVIEVTTAGSVDGDAATMTTALAGADNDLTFTARQGGTLGNGIMIAYVDPAAASQSLSVSVSGQIITVSLATDGVGNIISTAAQIREAINQDADAAALVSASLAAGDDGTGVVTAMNHATLAGGLDNGASFRVSEDGGVTWTAADTFDASMDTTGLYGDTGLLRGVSVAFQNQGTLSVGDRFIIDVGHYQGDYEDIELNISRSNRLQINLTAEDVFGDQNSAEDDNLFDILKDFERALEQNDDAAVGEILPRLDTARQRILDNLSNVGAKQNRLEVRTNIFADESLNLTDALSDREDVDIVQAITDLQIAEQSYQAALTAASMVTQVSLVDYIS
jgi:flagellar hook-associated protein 3 FlgL